MRIVYQCFTMMCILKTLEIRPEGRAGIGDAMGGMATDDAPQAPIGGRTYAGRKSSSPQRARQGALGS